jgi:hypothetical protein
MQVVILNLVSLIFAVEFIQAGIVILSPDGEYFVVEKERF